MILRLNTEFEVPVSFVKETITFQNAVIHSTVKIDIENNCLNELQDSLFSAETATIILYADDDNELKNYSNYGISHLEQSIQDDIIITSILLENSIETNNE